MTVNVRIGQYRQVVTLSAPGTPAPDGDGGYIVAYTELDLPEWRCAILAASASIAQRHFAQTVIAQASNIMIGRFHPDLQVGVRATWVDRVGVTHTANVLGVEDVEGAGVQTIAIVIELDEVTTPEPADSWIQEGWTQ